ncbi:MAG: type 1 glutamine amidotransferase [Silicimonas sp.]|nr:type 1 glutamine amidotransferase [Silicimonas sp.]
MLIGILQCGHFPIVEGHPPRTYSDLYSGLLAGQGFEFRTWSVVDMAFPDGVEAADGWLITGSKHGAYEDHPFIPPLEDFIRAAFEAGVPQVGICFGHQILAQALGGRVEKFSGGWSAGRVVYDFDGENVPLVAWHQDQVVEVPAGAEVVARTDFCAHAALSYGKRAFSMQPHPEFDVPATRLLLEARAPGVLSSEMISEATEALEAPLAQDRAARMIGDFFKEARNG